METIFLDGQEFTYEISKKNIRSVRLSLTSKNSFIVSCHSFTPKFLIEKFIRKNSDWIIKNSFKIHEKLKVSSLENIKILDVDYKIVKSKSTRDWVIINRNEQTIYLNIKTDSETHLKHLLSVHLKTLALSLIKDELDILKKQFGFDFNRIALKNQKTRFGSCSSHGNLNFNWQIIFFPPEKFRHILLHELTHLDIKNHSKKFWDQLTIYDPNCKINNRWLKEQGTKYLIF
jgi:predicted metal-dependent hydrolase